ncbi:peptidoglycan editing factor PgeF [Paucisalibacillus globulus]|uniref:peptidoglycan editing factor PgeF n=1 Tax=Paucisalibacillus globulus TaxID=351095 RepID=UPI00040C83A4|nr:peptidoglycan editing factor PgeF [Paucisalibacillus globulus]
MQDVFEYDGKQLLYIKKWMNIDSNLKVGFTSRNGGTSKGYFSTNNFGLHVSDSYDNAIENRNKLAKILHISLEQWVSGEQVHHNSIHIVESTDVGRGARSVESSLKGIDGLITRETAILCTAFFADCVPLFFFDPVTKYIGIAHAGWKGTVGRIAEEMTNKFLELGCNKNDVLVTIGPCISCEYYEVDEYVKNRIPQELADRVLTSVSDGHYLLDLKQLNVEILVQSGIFRSNIDITNYCTFRDENLFFSHRRDNGKTGRMLGFIGYSG